MPKLSIAATLLLASVVSCVAIDDDYCNDSIAGAPACPTGGGDGGGSGGGSPAVVAKILPANLGDGGETELVAVGGSALLRFHTEHLGPFYVSLDGVRVEPVADGEWLVAGVRDGAAVNLAGTNLTTGRPFSTNLPIRAEPVSTIVLAASARYVQLSDAAPAFLAVPGGTAPRPFVQLRSLAGDRLVDTSLTLAAGTADATEQVEWDHLQLPTTTGTHHLVLAADSFEPRTIDVTVVDRLDRLETSRPDASTRCFHAVTAEREVFADWVITVDGAAAVAAPLGANCVTVTGTIVARAGGLELTD